jgi:EAL domain-containing protein (putative c-di-GMP-specific phosphodiesterase class I)
VGKSLKHIVIAEGVETDEQRAYLQSQHCEEGPGYLFGRPVAAAQFARLLQMGIKETVVHKRDLASCESATLGNYSLDH